MEVCNKIAGMLGRNAEVKDWPAFCDVGTAARARSGSVEFWGVGVTEDEAVAEFGDAAKAIQWKGKQPDGRKWIGKMDLFLLTSKHEEMPTVVLEAFAERTAICGFIPVGGMSEILSFSQGPLKEVFIKERDTSRLAEIALSLLNDEAKRQAVIEDGWQIVTQHFAAGKIVPGQLVPIYRKLCGNRHERVDKTVRV